MIEMILRKLVLEENLLTVLNESVLESPSFQHESGTLLITMELIMMVLRLSSYYNIENVFNCFEKEGCLETLEDHQLNLNQTVASKALQIVLWYSDY